MRSHELRVTQTIPSDTQKKYTHTVTYTLKHARTYSHKHSIRPAYAHVQVHEHSCTFIHVSVYVLIHTHIHVYTLFFAHEHSDSQLVNTHTHRHTRIRIIFKSRLILYQPWFKRTKKTPHRVHQQIYKYMVKNTIMCTQHNHLRACIPANTRTYTHTQTRVRLCTNSHTSVTYTQR